MKNLVPLLACVVLAAISLNPAGAVADAPRDLKWAELIPAGSGQSALKPKTFFSGSATNPADGNPPPPQLPEGKFMSLKSQQPGASGPPAIVAALDGARVRIGGYVVPLDFEQTTIKEFLLVPFVGACIHVPPPPPNQIIYVKAANGLEITGSFDPVSVTGKLKAETAFTGLADAGYSIEAEAVELIKP